MAICVTVSVIGFASGDYYLCVQSLFLSFIPYILWSAYSRVGSLDIFAPDVGFPLAYILYLYAGSLNVPLETQFGITLPWIVWLYYILGLVAYLIGVRLLKAPSPKVAAANGKKRFWPSDRFLGIATGLFLVGLAARAVVVAQSGIPFFHANDINARVEGSGGLLGVLALCMEAAFECFMLYILVKRPRGLSRWLIPGAMLIVLLNGIGTTNRTAFLRIVFAAFVLTHYTIKRFSFTAVLVFGILGASFASLLGTFRDVSDWGDARVHSLEKQGFTDQTYWLFNGYEALRLPTETFYMTINQVPALNGYTYGATSLASLAEVLPGHRPGPSEIVKNTLRLRFVGFGAAATILAPLWFDGGVLGILLGMFLIGAISRALHQQMLKSQNYLWTLVYAWYVQNAFKAIKDDILPELGFTFVIFLFVVVSIYATASDAPVRLRLLNPKRFRPASNP
jgi:oligosaccharide repeat unit polymerase